MPRKQATVNDSSAGAAPARAAKAPRVKSAKHTKAAAPETIAPEMEAQVEPAIEMEVVAMELEPAAVVRELVVVEQVPAGVIEQAQASAPVSVSSESAREEIARIAYGYWEARGYASGNAAEDWARAEEEYRRRHAA